MSQARSDIALFLDMMAAERGAAANTLDAYRRDLDDVAARLAGAGIELRAAATADLEGVLDGLRADGLSAATAARRLSAMKRFYRFLLSEMHLKSMASHYLHHLKPMKRMKMIQRKML